MSANHDEQSLASAYVLGALDATERRAFEAHSATCAECQREIRELQPVAIALAYAVPKRTPRPELRARVLAAAGASDTRETRRESVPASARTWLPLAATVLVAIALAATAWRLQSRVLALEARLEQAERRALGAERLVADTRRAAGEAQSALAILAAPDLVRIDLAGQPPAPRATARALWSRSNGMVFTTANLPPPPPGRVYQVWVVTREAPVSAGLLALNPSGRTTAVFQTPADIGTPVAAAVTLEPEGGVPSPTGQKYLIGTPQSQL
jgi:anti-sigma-K factor RskA